MKYLWAGMLMVVAVTVQAERAEVGQPFPVYTLMDQFGKTNTLAETTRFVVVASEKQVSTGLNAWLKTKEAGYLADHAAEYVSDIEPMPGIITVLFALPKMKKYPFPVLLAREKSFAATYPSEAGRIAVFHLDAGQVLTAVSFVETPAEVEALLVAGQEPAAP
jgi:hypothetical protein